jgi:glycerol-3-phosphate dehydrogenase (NAD(P)+)
LSEIETVGVIGAGAWGTALALACTRAGRKALIWSHEPSVAEAIRTGRENPLYLPGVILPDAVQATTDLSEIAACDMVLAVAPAQHMRSVLAGFAPHAREGLPVLLCAKGVEQVTLKLMSDVLAETVPQAAPAVLSGPSFAADVARGLPTAVTLACADQACAERLARAIASPAFRPYLSTDMIGAEAGGAIKNVLAIACGVSEGRGLGRSAHAALITRGFAEMTRFAVALGARAETMPGLCGLGDLVLTCSSPQSRNMSVGLALGGGQTLEQALSGKLSVAEGVASAPGVVALGRRLGVETPISAAVAAILAGETGVDKAIGALLSRPLKVEQGWSNRSSRRKP